MAKPKPGEVYDRRGVPIYPGDLLRSFHFKTMRGRTYYLYHTAIWNAEKEVMEMVPTSELEPTKCGQGGRCWLFQDLADREQVTVIHGYGPEKGMDYTDRPRVKRLANST